MQSSPELRPEAMLLDLKDALGHLTPAIWNLLDLLQAAGTAKDATLQELLETMERIAAGVHALSEGLAAAPAMMSLLQGIEADCRLMAADRMRQAQQADRTEALLEHLTALLEGRL